MAPIFINPVHEHVRPTEFMRNRRANAEDGRAWTIRGCILARHEALGRGESCTTRDGRPTSTRSIPFRPGIGSSIGSVTSTNADDHQRRNEQPVRDWLPDAGRELTYAHTHYRLVNVAVTIGQPRDDQQA